MNEPIVSSEWSLLSSPQGKIRCVSCGELHDSGINEEEGGKWTQEGMVWDRVHFLALCKRCALEVVAHAASLWPAEVAESMAKGVRNHTRATLEEGKRAGESALIRRMRNNGQR